MKSSKIIIGQRINTLLAIKNKKQKDLAEYLNVTDNTISYFCNGKRMPNTEQIIKISTFFSVSTDYILGLSEVSTTDVKIKDICEYLELSEKAVKSLKRLFSEENHEFIYEEFEDKEKVRKSVNYFLESMDAYIFFWYFADFLVVCEKKRKLYKELENTLGDNVLLYKQLRNSEYFDLAEKEDLYLFRAQRAINSLAKYIKEAHD